MERTLKYIFRAALFCILASIGICHTARGQYRSDRLYGLRIGTDLSRIAVHYLNTYRTDITVHADARIDTNLYIAAEAGWNKTHLNNKPAFDYKSNGYFLKAGVDYNLLHPSFPFESNMAYIGFRYGAARMERKVPSYSIQYPYWGNVKGDFPSQTLIPQWAEAIVGLKVEVLHNLFLDWGLHIRVLVTQNIGKDFRPYLIPGFGKATSNAVFDANYTISYRIPLWHPTRKKTIPKPQLPKPNSGEKSTVKKKSTGKNNK